MRRLSGLAVSVVIGFSSLRAQATVTEYFIAADRVRLHTSHESMRSWSGTRNVASTYWPASNQVWAEASKSVRLELLDDKGQVSMAINSLLVAESTPDLTAYSSREANLAEKEEASDKLKSLVSDMEARLTKAGKSRVVIVVTDSTVKINSPEERKTK